jgi:glycosyltransferase involved in cell wall biosynthesis
MRIALDIRRAGDFGIGTYLRNILQQLARQDSENQYLLIGAPRHLEEIGSLPENFSSLPFEAEPGTFRTHLRLPLLLENHRIDLLHMPWFYAPAFVPCRLVITVHDLTEIAAPEVGSSRVVQTARLWFARRALERADRILAVSENAKRELERGFEVPAGKVEVVYNAVEERFLTEPIAADADHVLARYAVDGPFVLYVGNIRPQKNLARLIEAFAVVKDELRDDPKFAHLKLIVIGDSLAPHPDLRRAVVRTRLREDVRFLGFVPLATLRVFYASARAFLFPSLYEGFGLPPLEAMAHGAPVLASDTSALPEVLGDAALLVNSENVFELAKGIRQIVTDDDLRARLIAAGRAQVRKYSWERAAKQVLQVYENALASGRDAKKSAAPHSSVANSPAEPSETTEASVVASAATKTESARTARVGADE